MKELQHSKILRMLTEAGATGVPNYKFATSGILSYSRRLWELKQEGHMITMDRDFVNGRASNVFRYFLIVEPKKKHWYSR